MAENEVAEKDELLAEATQAGRSTESEELKAELLLRRQESEELRGAAASLQGEVEMLRKELATALQGYRLALLQASPELPEEMVQGESVAALESSLQRARALVARVRTTLEAEQARGRVPAGAPPRRAPDLSALSPQEKIAYGLAQRV
ncbi:MAG: hypothetical protein HY685_05715 [Chloroflexi bacterium]|nr:hypothetical protein [Chloroflexota bacterium]